jgi:hypothetical protein
MVLEYSSKSPKTMERLRNFHDHFWISWTIFLSKWYFTTKRLFRALDQSNPWERYWKFPDISYFTDLKQTRGAKKIPKTALKTRLKLTCTLFFGKYLVISFRSQSIRRFSVCLEDSLRIISGTWRAEKNLKTDSDSAHQH